MTEETSVIERLAEQVEHRYAELNAQLADPEVINNRSLYTQVARDHGALEQAHALAQEYRKELSDTAGAEELLAGDLDGDERKEFQDMVSKSRVRWQSWPSSCASRWSRATPTTPRT